MSLPTVLDEFKPAPGFEIRWASARTDSDALLNLSPNAPLRATFKRATDCMRSWEPFLTEPNLSLVIAEYELQALLSSVEIRILQIKFEFQHTGVPYDSSFEAALITFSSGCDRYRAGIEKIKVELGIYRFTAEARNNTTTGLPLPPPYKGPDTGNPQLFMAEFTSILVTNAHKAFIPSPGTATRVAAVFLASDHLLKTPTEYNTRLTLVRVATCLNAWEPLLTNLNVTHTARCPEMVVLAVEVKAKMERLTSLPVDGTLDSGLAHTIIFPERAQFYNGYERLLNAAPVDLSGL
ncbi:hypothetical protein FB45DRAFT_879367 [Roridomyces roridus]|uniref:Uncharacterized protein n=1 Tax=Roridomyces roridus TaxID=1738132 RepID=A0AAD7F928_9AGAR|nr:hypothetical protein FB45DRAFT_879367 [Roridomyces roridus]